MKTTFTPRLLCCLFGLLLAGFLSGCSLFRPYRLPTPPVSPETIARRKAEADKKKATAGVSKKSTGPSEETTTVTDESTPTGPATSDAEKKEPVQNKKLHFDKNGLMKGKPKLTRRRYHKYGKPFRPFQGISNLFHSKHHAKSKPKNADSEDNIPDVPPPDPKP